MKWKYLIYPAIAIAVSGLMVGGQRQTISRLRSESAELSSRITAIRDGTDRTDASSTRSRSIRPVSNGTTINWKAFAREIASREQLYGSARKKLSIERRLLAMDVQELTAALDELAALDIDDETRYKLELMILNPLASKDPEAALTRFKHRLFDPKENFSFLLSRVFANWVEKDLPATIAWYQKEAAAGTFDGKQLSGENKTRDEYESWLVAGTLRTDPSLAEALLSGKSYEERKEILSSTGCLALKERHQAALAALVRSQLDDASRVQFISELAYRYAEEGDLDGVEAYLNRIGAKPDEIAKVYSRGGLAELYMDSKVGNREPKVEDIENLRTWLVEKGSATPDLLVGQTIAERTGPNKSLDFASASALLQQYRDTPGGEALIVGFVNGCDPFLFENEARKLAESITDPELRKQLNSALVRP